jgi:zinc transport system substrate-binding protein
MMKNRIIISLLLIYLTSPAFSSAKELNILATTRPIYGLIEGVSGNKNKINILIDQNQSPHNYNLKPSDVVKIKSANIIFMIDNSFEFGLATYLDKNSVTAKVIKFSNNPNITLLKNRHELDLVEDKTHEHEAHHHEVDGFDMHFWLDPNNAEAMINEIANVLSSLDPENRKFYYENAKNYIQQLRIVDQQLKVKFATNNQPFIVFHDAYQYFSHHYHLKDVGVVIINHNITPGIKTMQQLQTIINKNNAKCIFAEPQFAPNVIQKIANATHIKVGIIDGEYGNVNTDKNIYLDLLESITNNMIRCFNQSN